MIDWKRKPWLIVLFVAAIGAAFLYFDRSTYPRNSHNYLAIAGISILEEDAFELLEKNEIEHFIAGDIALGMATLYCSPEDHEYALTLIDALPQEKEHLFYRFDKPFKRFDR